MCFRTYESESGPIIQFLESNPTIKDECLNLFIESQMIGIKKLKEYLDKVNLYCPMLYKKHILNDFKFKLEEK